jgi:hypothetical protein
MLKEMRNLKGMSVIGAVLALLVIVGTYKTTGQEEASPRQRVAHDEWEYLAVAGPNPASVSVDPHKRKEPNVPFGREAFALEQHLDQLGAKGWELVAVAGPPTDPAYYFKRRK